MAFVQIVPHLERSICQRHIVRVFKIGAADDSRLPVRTALVMGRTIPINPQYFPSFFGSRQQRCATHPAVANYDTVVNGRLIRQALLLFMCYSPNPLATFFRQQGQYKSTLGHSEGKYIDSQTPGVTNKHHPSGWAFSFGLV